MKKILFTAVAVVGLISGTTALHAEGDGAVCPVTGKTASGETAKKDSKDSSKKADKDSCCSASKGKK